MIIIENDKDILSNITCSCDFKKRVGAVDVFIAAAPPVCFLKPKDVDDGRLVTVT
jgi:hypothetical protein